MVKKDYKGYKDERFFRELRKQARKQQEKQELDKIIESLYIDVSNITEEEYSKIEREDLLNWRVFLIEEAVQDYTSEDLDYIEGFLDYIHEKIRNRVLEKLGRGLKKNEIANINVKRICPQCYSDRVGILPTKDGIKLYCSICKFEWFKKKGEVAI
jgi:hypothetical protein